MTEQDDRPRVVVFRPPESPQIDVARVPVDPNGCPYCDDYPDFPRKHCGKPRCRDAQAIAYARATGQKPTDVIRGQNAEPKLTIGSPSPTPTVPPGLCSSCVLAQACTVGRAIADAPALAAVVAACKGHRRP